MLKQPFHWLIGVLSVSLFISGVGFVVVSVLAFVLPYAMGIPFPLPPVIHQVGFMAILSQLMLIGLLVSVRAAWAILHFHRKPDK